MNRELREFRRLERVCLEQAALSTMDLTRSGLLKVADDCRIAAEAIEAQAPRGVFAEAVQALKQALSAKAKRH
jgi:predicted kinase